jgi:hypothetical protein
MSFISSTSSTSLGTEDEVSDPENPKFNPQSGDFKEAKLAEYITKKPHLRCFGMSKFLEKKIEEWRTGMNEELDKIDLTWWEKIRSPKSSYMKAANKLIALGQKACNDINGFRKYLKTLTKSYSGFPASVTVKGAWELCILLEPVWVATTPVAKLIADIKVLSQSSASDNDQAILAKVAKFNKKHEL